VSEQDDQLRKTVARLERKPQLSGTKRLILALTAVVILLLGVAERYEVSGTLSDIAVELHVPPRTLERVQFTIETGLFAVFLIFLGVATLGRMALEQMLADTTRAMRNRLSTQEGSVPKLKGVDRQGEDQTSTQDDGLHPPD